MKITFFGHASVQVQINGAYLVFDPFITPNEKAAHIDVDAIKADYVLLSHGHADHVADVERIAKNNSATIVSSFEAATWFGNKGYPNHPMNHGGKKQFVFGTVKFVHATHSSVLPDGTYGGNPGGFVVWGAGQCFYFAGDTGLMMDMKLIPLTCPKLDVAILPIGDNFTMGYEDAALAAEFIGCNTVIGIHYDTFDMIKIDHDAAKKAFEQRGKKLILPALGQTIEL
ncbi:MAG: metal-dependent hydrolase [Saprospiraceae bacterium]|nr:MAG: metal-dependent hydrolase [Saprospiraceae bacterium]